MIKIPAQISRCSLLENTSISPKEQVHANPPMLVGLASEKFILAELFPNFTRDDVIIRLRQWIYNYCHENRPKNSSKAE